MKYYAFPVLRMGYRVFGMVEGSAASVHLVEAQSTADWYLPLLIFASFYLSLSQRCDEGLQCSGMRRCFPRCFPTFRGNVSPLS